jgi:hypothetical protein
MRSGTVNLVGVNGHLQATLACPVTVTFSASAPLPLARETLAAAGVQVEVEVTRFPGA